MYILCILFLGKLFYNIMFYDTKWIKSFVYFLIQSQLSLLYHLENNLTFLWRKTLNIKLKVKMTWWSFYLENSIYSIKNMKKTHMIWYSIDWIIKNLLISVTMQQFNLISWHTPCWKKVCRKYWKIYQQQQKYTAL